MGVSFPADSITYWAIEHLLSYYHTFYVWSFPDKKKKDLSDREKESSHQIGTYKMSSDLLE